MFEQHRRAVGSDEQRRRVAGAGVAELTGARVEDAAEDRAAERAGDQGGEAVHGGQRLRRAGVLQQQRPAGAAQLPHHGRGLEAVPDTVADHDPDPPVGQFDEVIPVAGREPRGKPGRPEDGPLQGQRGFPLLIREVGPVQRLAEVPAQQGEQRPVLGGERPGRIGLDPHRQLALRVLDGHVRH